MANNTADDITVTTATQSEADVRAQLGEKPAEKPAPPAAPAAGTPVAAAAATTPEQEADSARPDPEVSEAARTLRQSRLSEKVKRLKDDTGLYEDNIRRMGGTVTPMDARQYANPQAEIDHWTRRRHELLQQTNRLLRQPRREPAAPPAPAAATTRPAATAAVAAEPTFAFPSWEEYQATHPEADYVQYTDERSDARDSWKDGVRQATATHTAEKAATEARDRSRATALTEMEHDAETYRSRHPDFDTHLDALAAHLITQGGAAIDDNGQLVFGFKWQAARDLLYRTPKEVAPVLDYLATHPAEVARLVQAATPADVFDTVAEIRFTVRSAQAAAPAPAAAAAAAAAPPVATVTEPPKPTTAAPAPLEPVSGTAQSTRSLHQLADDSENVDDGYRETRSAQLRRTG